MDVMLRRRLGSPLRDVVERELLRLDRTPERSESPVTSKTMEAREMVLYLLWILTLTAPLIALTLTAGCAPLPRTASETSFVTTANDAAAVAVPPEVAGE